MSAAEPAPGAAPREAPWYEVWFDSDLYERVYAERDAAEAERLARLVVRTLALPPGAAVLDVGTGRGRHARALARRGLRVTGLDLAPRALAAARARAAAEGLDITFVEGDMRRVRFRARFDAVVNLFTSFGFFDTDREHADAVAAMAAALRPGGRLVQDFLCADYVRAHLVPHDEREADGLTVRQERWIEEDAPGGPRVHKRITVRAPGHAEHVYTESVRLLTRDDFARYYAAAGLRLVRTFGDYDGAPAAPGRPRLILVAERSR
ncbi:MAG: SAM-dependent methyltransferase [Rubricoccaceae bacterium]